MLPTGHSVTSTPVVVNGNVYFGDWGGTVYSVRVATGEVNWKATLHNAISSSVAVAQGLVYVSLSPEDSAAYPPHTGDRVVALSQSTGHVVWSTRFSSTAQGVWGSPIVFDGLVFIGAAGGIGQEETIPPFVGGDVLALDDATGRIVWRRTLNGTAGGAGLWGSVAASPVLNSIFLATANSYVNTGTTGDAYSLISLDPRTGRERWRFRAYPKFDVGQDADFGATPNIFQLKINGIPKAVVGIGSKDGNYYVVDARNGQLVRKIFVQPNGGVIGNSAMLGGFAHVLAFVPTFETSLDIANPLVCCGALVAVDITTSKVLWYVSARANIIGSVSLVPGGLFFGDAKGNVFAVSTSGHTVFHATLPDSIQSGVTPAEGHVFVTTCRGDPTPGYEDPSMPITGLGLYAYGL